MPVLACSGPRKCRTANSGDQPFPARSKITPQDVVGKPQLSVSRIQSELVKLNIYALLWLNNNGTTFRTLRITMAQTTIDCAVSETPSRTTHGL